MLGVMNVVPLPKLEPPEEAAYQSSVPILDVALKETVPVPQCVPGVVEEITGNGLMVIVFVKVAVALEQAPVPFAVKVTITEPALASAALGVYVADVNEPLLANVPVALEDDQLMFE